MQTGAVQGTEVSAFCSATVSHVPERLISSFTKPKTLISSSGERLALSVLIWNLITQSPRVPFCQLPDGCTLYDERLVFSARVFQSNLGSPDATMQLQGIVNGKNVFYESFPYS
ncbi:hypothetical protein POTOM_014264 [Populus tomentosa]|uniref:Uncharacterized protein n=1 Tax=Populus tomentosa TaxID=118781 RepID=A0A8X8A6D5_POPTO|nr:hypothetical protein POTOM_014264 [Populus tomentosa]